MVAVDCSILRSWQYVRNVAPGYVLLPLALNAWLQCQGQRIHSLPLLVRTVKVRCDQLFLQLPGERDFTGASLPQMGSKYYKGVMTKQSKPYGLRKASLLHLYHLSHLT